MTELKDMSRDELVSWILHYNDEIMQIEAELERRASEEEDVVCYCGSKGPEDGCFMPVYDCYNEGQNDE